MKSNKIYAFLLAAAVLAGCSKEEEISWNSADATVSMGQAELVVKENKGMVNVPVVVAGELDGAVEVTVEVAELGENPAMEDVHYILTSETVIIPADATEGKIEFKTVDDADINEARTFVITIKSANGATVNEEAKITTVTLKDNDSQFYEKLQGKWKWSANNGGQSWNVTILGAEEGEDGYNEVLYVTGVGGSSATSMTMYYSYDVATKTGYVYIPFGYVFGQLNFSGLGICDVVTITAVDGNVSMEGGLIGTWNEDFTEITFEENKIMYGGVFQNGSFLGTFFNSTNIKMTK